MKKLLIGILLIFTTLALAKDIDINKAKGISQDVIVSLAPIPAQTDVSKDVVIKAKFTVALDPKFIQKNEITLKRITQTKKNAIDGSIIYSAEEKSLAFIPIQSLREGYYEISIKSLRTLGEEKDTHIGGIKYRFYVPEVINGYVLPPEPDPDLNNATLLGIDSNDNGIRDDVERFIVIKYEDHHKIVTEIGFQGARAYQKILENPLNTAENHKALHDALDCNFYFESRAQYFGDPILVNHYIDDKYKSLELNTKARVKTYLEYDNKLSGGVYEMTKADKMKQKCAFDVDGLLGGE